MSKPVKDYEGHGRHEARKEEEEERESGDPGVAFVDQRLGVDDRRQVVPDAEKDAVDDQLCPSDANPFPALWRIVRGTNHYLPNNVLKLKPLRLLLTFVFFDTQLLKQLEVKKLNKKAKFHQQHLWTADGPKNCTRAETVLTNNPNFSLAFQVTTWAEIFSCLL